MHDILDGRMLANFIDGLRFFGAAARPQRRHAPLFRKGHDPTLARPGLHLPRQIGREIFGGAVECVDLQVARPEFHKLHLFFERDLQLDVAQLAGIADDVLE